MSFTTIRTLKPVSGHLHHNSRTTGIAANGQNVCCDRVIMSKQPFFCISFPQYFMLGNFCELQHNQENKTSLLTPQSVRIFFFTPICPRPKQEGKNGKGSVSEIRDQPSFTCHKAFSCLSCVGIFKE